MAPEGRGVVERRIGVAPCILRPSMRPRASRSAHAALAPVSAHECLKRGLVAAVRGWGGRRFGAARPGRARLHVSAAGGRRRAVQAVPGEAGGAVPLCYRLPAPVRDHLADPNGPP